MLFPTIEFAIFFILVFSSSWLLIKIPRARRFLLILASYFFYGFWDWRFTFLLFFSSLFNYLCGLAIGRSVNIYKRQFFLFISVLINLGLLFFFKYFDFFFRNIRNLSLELGTNLPQLDLDIILPVGISFFTFQAMSYVIDVYRGDLKQRRSLLDVMLYISFFPQLVAGPIVRASDFLPQLNKQPNINQIKTSSSLLRIITGLFKKMIISNYLANLLVDPVFLDPLQFNSLEVLAAGYGYSVQIFCDFSAYSDIAIGCAALLGYSFPENFNSPYKADSLKDFWRRWHISLSSWLRDYLYIPLGGSRKGKIMTYRNLLLTMLLGGLWHGAAWNFIIWGAMHGLGLALERFFKLGKSKNIFFRSLRIVFVFHFVTLAWVFFRSPDMEIASAFFQALVNFQFAPGILSPFIIILLLIGMSFHFIPKLFQQKLSLLFSYSPLFVQGLVLALSFFLLSVLGPEGVAPFIYFQF